MQASIAKVDQSKVRYDASAAGSCMAAYGNVVQSCKFDDTDSIESACEHMFVGLVPLGGTCASGSECAPQADGHASCHFEFSNDTSTGTCRLDAPSMFTAAPHGTLGQACIGSCQASSCDSSPTGQGSTVTAICFASEGLYCGTGETCQPLLADGQPCSFAGCAATSYCDVTCKPQKADGSQCVISDECTSHECEYADSGNNPVSGTCGTGSIATAKSCMGDLD
jgi:hypothetical protein